MRPVKLLAVGAAALLALTACTSGTSEPEPDAGGDAGGGDSSFVIGYSGAVQSNPNNKAIEDAMRNKVEELGGEFIVTDANFDVSKQFADIQSLINRDIDVLVIWPLDPQSAQPAIQQAADEGIPVIVQDTEEGGPYTSKFQVTNFDAAKNAASLIEETVGENAKVGQVLGLQSVGVLEARNQGFTAGAEELGLEILASQLNETDNADGARPIADAWKTRFGTDMQAVFAYNDPSALGIASAKSPEFDPVVIGMNGSDEGVAAVQDGRLLATYDFLPVQVGAGLGWAAMHVADGGELPEEVIIEAELITEENADEWRPVSELLGESFNIEIVEEDGVSKLIAQVG